MSETIALSELESRLGEFVDRAAEGEDIIIERAGAAVAKLVGVMQSKAEGERVDLSNVIASLSRLRNEIAAQHPPLTLSTILSWRDEGRH